MFQPHRGVPAFHCGLPVRKWQPPCSRIPETDRTLSMIIIVIYHKKSQVQPAEVAIMAQRQDKLLEESEAVRPEEEGFHGVGNSVKMSNDYEQSNP